MCLCGFERLNFRNGTAKSSINTGGYTVDYLLCGDLPYPAWKKRVSAQDLRNRRIRRYFVCRLKRSEARDFSHVRFTLQESVVGEQIFVYNHKDICLFRHEKYFERCKR